MIEYVLGFAFSKDKRDVVLIEKQKPDFMIGKLNGVGGKLESYDTHPAAAMQREFKEETGLLIPLPKRILISDELVNEGCWMSFALVQSESYKLHCFRAFTDDIYKCRTQPDEIEDIYILQVEKALQMDGKLMSNLKTLIPMARHEYFVFGKFEVK